MKKIDRTLMLLISLSCSLCFLISCGLVSRPGVASNVGGSPNSSANSPLACVNGKAALQTAPSGNSTDIAVFSKTLYQAVKSTTMNCAFCHAARTPSFANPNSSLAFSEAMGKINFSDLSTSTLVLFAGNGHCGFPDICGNGTGSAGNSAFMLNALKTWAQSQVDAYPDTCIISSPSPTPTSIPPTGYSSQDLVRISDLKAIAAALTRYYAKNKTYLVSGGGYLGGGQGWVSYIGGSYANSVTKVLYTQGLLAKSDYPDPAQGETGYMIYLCNGNQSFSLSATLDNPTSNDFMNAYSACNGNSPNNGIVPYYGKNFAVTEATQ